MNGKQVRINRQLTVDGIRVGHFFDTDVDPIWLHQNKLWELLPLEGIQFEAHRTAESETT